MENNMETYEVAEQNNEGVEIMEDMVNNEVTEKENGLGFLAGVGIGAAAGAALASGTWIFQTKIRRDVLKALKFSLDVHALKETDSEAKTIKKGRKEVSIETIDLRGRIKLMNFIHENLLKVKGMRKKEREEWYQVMKQLSNATVNAHTHDLKAENIVIVEETIENKNAE